MTTLNDRYLALWDKVQVSVYFGKRIHYVGSEKKFWNVNLEWHGKDTQVKVSVEAPTYEDALEEAFMKLEHLAKSGLPTGALAAPVEAKATEVTE